MDATSQLKEYGTDIRIKEPVPGDRPAADDSYAKPTRLPLDMKVVSMQWLGPDHKPMGVNDKFEIGKEYTLDLRIGFEGGEEMGQVYPVNYRDFKVNGKSTSSDAWIIDDYTLDYTNWHVWEFYGSYKVTDPNARGSVSGTVKSFNSASDKVTIQLIQQGHSEPAYETTVSGGTKEGNQYTASYTISGIASGTYTMRVLKKNHVTRKYTITVGGEAVTQNAEIWLLGDVNGDTIREKDNLFIRCDTHRTQYFTELIEWQDRSPHLIAGSSFCTARKWLPCSCNCTLDGTFFCSICAAGINKDDIFAANFALDILRISNICSGKRSLCFLFHWFLFCFRLGLLSLSTFLS